MRLVRWNLLKQILKYDTQALPSPSFYYNFSLLRCLSVLRIAASAILIKGADVSLIECEIARVLDDGTVTFKPTGNSGLGQGGLCRSAQQERNYPHPGNRRKSKRQLGQERSRFPSRGNSEGDQVVLQSVKGVGASKYVPLRMDELTIDVKVVANLDHYNDHEFSQRLGPGSRGPAQFPLGEGQTVSRFAMTVNGKLVRRGRGKGQRPRCSKASSAKGLIRGCSNGPRGMSSRLASIQSPQGNKRSSSLMSRN